MFDAVDVEIFDIEAVTSQCPCFEARLKSRHATNHFNRWMAPAKISITKFHLLVEIETTPGCNLSEIAYAMGMERSGLSRAVNILIKSGFLIQSIGQDKRECVYALTNAGREVVQKAYPLWEKALNEMSSL